MGRLTAFGIFSLGILAACSTAQPIPQCIPAPSGIPAQSDVPAQLETPTPSEQASQGSGAAESGSEPQATPLSAASASNESQRRKSTQAAVKPTAANVVIGDQSLDSKLELLGLEEELGWHFHSPGFRQSPAKGLEFKSKTRVGGTFTSGNESSITISGLQDFVIRKGLYRTEISIGGIYGKDSIEGERISTNRLFFARPQLEYAISKDFYLYTGSGYEQYRAAGVRHLGSLEAGVGNYLFETETTVIKGEFGYHLERELRISPFGNDTINALDLGVEFSKQLRQGLLIDIEVTSLFDVEDQENFRSFGNLSLLLAITRHFALGVTLSVRYDNQPVASFKRVDTYHTFDIAMLF